MTPTAAKAVLDETLASTRIARWIQLLSTMSVEDATPIAEMLADQRKEGRDYPTATILFWENWAKMDTSGALAYLREHEDAAGAAAGMEPFMKAWARNDPQGAMAALAQLGDSSLSGQALSGVSYGLADSNPAVAVDFVGGIPEIRQVEASRIISRTIVQELKIDQAQAWFDGLATKSPVFQQEAVYSLLESMGSRSEPGAIGKFATERLDQGWAARPSEQSYVATMILRNGGSPWEYMGAALEKYPNAANPLAFAENPSGLSPQSAVEWANANPSHRSAETILAGAVKMYRQRGQQDEAAALLSRIRTPALRSALGSQ